MAQIRLSPPDPFNFRTPDDWPRWTRRFEQFRVASGLADDEAVKQVNTLLYCIGEEAEAVLTSMNATAEERKVYNTVVAKFDAFFKVRRNVIYERARFNRQSQLEGESAEQFIMELYTLAENCNYGAMTDEMIRDRLAVGIRDATLSQQLQLDADLTLEKVEEAHQLLLNVNYVTAIAQMLNQINPYAHQLCALGQIPTVKASLHICWHDKSSEIAAVIHRGVGPEALRAQGEIILCSATTGLAALNYEGGMIAHSMYKIPVTADDEVPQCNVSFNSQRAELLTAAAVHIWDEFPMSHHKNFKAVSS